MVTRFDARFDIPSNLLAPAELNIGFMPPRAHATRSPRFTNSLDLVIFC